VDLHTAINNFNEGYFSTCKRSSKTEDAYRTDLLQFEQQIGCSTALTAIGVDGLERWAKHLQQQEYAPASIRRKFAALRVFFAYWVRKGDLSNSPIGKIRLDLARQQLLPRALMAAEVKLMMEKAWCRAGSIRGKITGPSDARLIALRNLVCIEILFATGMRVGELSLLRMGDWRDEETTFVVRGKGGRQRLALLPDERSAYAVREYLSCRRSLDLKHDAVLVNATGNQLSTQTVGRFVANLGESCALNRRVTPHMIRHTVATLLLRHGADIRVV
jgi:site-specific recombinase XerD